MGRADRALEVAATVARVAYAEDVKYPAAALAYYAFVSFVPLLLLVFSVVGERFALRVYTVTPRFLTIEAQRLIYEAMTEAAGRTGGGVLAILVLAWSGANVAVGVGAVVERVEDVEERSLADQLRDAAVVLGSFGLAIVSIVTTSIVFGLTPSGVLIGFIRFAVLFGVLSVVFLPLYYVPSRVATTPMAALPGAVTAAFGWTVIHNGVRFYALNATRYAIYGVLSGIIVILTSLYLAAVVLLTGIVVNATLAGEGDRPDPTRDG